MKYENELGIKGNIDILFKERNKINSQLFNYEQDKIRIEQEITENYLDNIEAQQQITEIQLNLLEKGK